MHHFKQMVPNRVKELEYGVKSVALSQFRQATWRNRPLPDFIIIGAQKSGTTSLFYYLAQHPQLVPSYAKEVHYFDGGVNPKVDNFKKGEAWYRSHFPLRRNINQYQKIFEASPLYLFNPLVPKRIAELIPEAKLIVLVRNPTERAISHYFHEQRQNRETLSMMEAFQAEEQRLESVIKSNNYKNDIFIHHSYKSRGLYYEQIKSYLQHFSREKILILNSEKFFTEPEDNLKRVFEFLEVDLEFSVKDLNPCHIASNKSKVSSDIYEYLNDYFCSPNQALYKLLGENYGW
jgi:hypothetical protein